VATQPTSPIYVPRPAEQQAWLGSPVSANPNIFGPPSTLQTRPPFIVPRPAEVQFWQWQPPFNPQLANKAKPSTPFYKLWRYDHVPQPDWVGTPQRSAPIQILGRKTTAKQKLWRWDHVPLPDWQMPVDWMNSNIIQILDHKPTSPQKLWRYDYDNDVRLWQGQPVPTNINTIPTTSPFHKLWRWDYEADRFWTGQPVASPLSLTNVTTGPVQAPVYNLRGDQEVRIWQWQPPFNPQLANKPSAAHNPFYKLWRYDIVPQPDWQMPIEWMNSAIIQQLDFKPTSPQKLWRWDYDSDVRLWLGQPVATNINTFPVPSTLQTLPPFIVPRPAEQQPWIWQPPFNPQLFAPSAPVQLYAVSPVWAPDADPPPQWVGTPKPVPLTIFNASVKTQSPFFRLWRWDYVPSPDWVGTPLSSLIIQQLDHKPTSPTKLWRYDYVPQPDWVGTPISAYAAFQLTKSPTSPTKFWRWDHVPTPDWLGTPVSSLIIRQLDFKPTSPTKFWRWDYVPSPDWVGTPLPAKGLQSLILAGKPYFKLWRWDYDSDVRLWLGQPEPMPFAIFKPNVKTIPPFFRLWRYDYDSDSRLWVGQPVASNIEFLPPAPPVPPPLPRRFSVKNLFPPNLTYTVANPNTSLPTPARTSPLVKVYLNEPATVYQVTASSVSLQFIRPDGTFYYVTGSPYTYISSVNGYPYIIYTSATGEFNQIGWWTAVFSIGNAVSQQFAFYIHPPGM